MRIRRIGGPLRRHVAAVEEMPGGVVLRQVTGAEVGGEQAEAALAPQVKLPQPVAGSVETLDEEQVLVACRLDMRDAPAVDADFCLGIEASQPEGFVCLGVSHVSLSCEVALRRGDKRRACHRHAASVPAVLSSRFRSPAGSAYGMRSRTGCLTDLAVRR